MALSAKKRDERLLIVDRLEVASGKTRDMAKAIEGLGVRSVLIVLATADAKLQRAARNLPGVKVIQVVGINVYDLLAYEHVVLVAEALKSLEERLSA